MKKKTFRTPEQIAGGTGDKVMISIRLRQSLLDQLDKVAKRADITRTELIESALADYVEFVKENAR